MWGTCDYWNWNRSFGWAHLMFSSPLYGHSIFVVFLLHFGSFFLDFWLCFVTYWLRWTDGLISGVHFFHSGFCVGVQRSRRRLEVCCEVEDVGLAFCAGGGCFRSRKWWWDPDVKSCLTNLLGASELWLEERYHFFIYLG